MNVSSIINELNRSANINTTQTSYQSGQQTISVERFMPVKPGHYPAVIILHGADGLTWSRSFYQLGAQTLAQRGYVAFIISYFDRTGSGNGLRQINRENFANWLKTIADGVTFVSGQPNVDSQRIGLLGISLGAYLSLSLASQDQRIGAVVEFAGGLPEYFDNKLKHMPPTLILHGQEDRLVSVKEAYRIEEIFKQKQVEYQMKIYPGQGHALNGPHTMEAIQAALSFLDKYLKT